MRQAIILSFCFLWTVFVACNQPATLANHEKKFDTLFALPPKMLEVSYDTSSNYAVNTISKLDAYYLGQVNQGFNGSVLVAIKGKVVYERYFGFSQREFNKRLDNNSAIHIASVTKPLTATAILYLFEKKLLHLDDPVGKYISGFPYDGVTVRMLLNHRSNLPDYTHWLPNYCKDMRTPLTNDKVIDLMIKYKPRVEGRPNIRFKYCNTNFVLLAKVIENVSHMSYSAFMSKYIFLPLRMNNTFAYSATEKLPISASYSYQYNWAREQDMFADGVVGDHGIYSTVKDMFLFDQSLYNQALLSKETIELSFGPCSFEKPGIKNYGLGWRLLCYPNGNKIVYHNGWWHGNNASFYRLLNENITIIILGNKFNKNIYRQAPVIYSIVKGVPDDGFDQDE